MLKLLFITLLTSFLFAPITNAQSASWLDTQPQTGNTGLDVFNVQLNSANTGLAIYPSSAQLPLNPSGNIPFALTVNGDSYQGDIYCLADEESISAGTGQASCIYGKSVTGHRIGPIIYQSNKAINTNDGTGGPGVIMWADRPNIDGYGNRGYLDIWAWGQSDSSFSNTINFGNRDSVGNPHRRLQITPSGDLKLPDLIGTGNSYLCVHSDGTVYRGTPTGC